MKIEGILSLNIIAVIKKNKVALFIILNDIFH